MTAQVRLAVVGLVHDHVWNMLPQFRDTGQVRFVAAVDQNAALAQRAEKEYGFEALLPDIDGLWSYKPDAVLCCTANSDTAAVAEACAARGVPLMIEKPLAANLAQARRIAGAAERSGIPVMCNWPTAWDARVRHAIELARAGELGDVYTLRYRAAHAGPREIGCSEYFYSWLYDAERNGAGALMDYCCYGAALACWLLGEPTAVTGVRGRLVKTDIPVEDNAILLMQYPHGFGVAEASWTQAGARPGGLQVLGARAGLLVERGQLWRVDADHPDGAAVEVPALPGDSRNGPTAFLAGLRQDRPAWGLCSLEVALAAQRVLEAGLLATRSGSAVPPGSL